MNKKNSTIDSTDYSNHQEAREAAKRLFKRNDEVSIEHVKEFDWGHFEVSEAIAEAENPHREPVILAYLYWVEELTQREIADRLGYSRGYIGQNMAEIPTGPDPTKHRASAGYYVNEDRGKVYSCYDGQSEFASEHRLLAVAEHGIEAVKGKVVHHENGHPLDNRAENIALMKKKEHDDLHASDDSEFVIEDGEAKLIDDPDDDARRAVEEWWSDVDELSVEDVEADVEADVVSQGA
jgi:transcriptional regulator with XRE-family HTH domain